MSDDTDLSTADRYKAALIFGPIVGIIVGGLFFGDSATGITVGVVVAILFVTIYPALAGSVVEELWDKAE